MKGFIWAGATFAVAFAIVVILASMNRSGLTMASADAATPACAFPTHPVGTPEETAWRLFVAANCPTTAGHVVWENWVEQLQLYPASGTTIHGPSIQSTVASRRLHGSPLALLLASKRRSRNLFLLPLPPGKCPPMTLPPPNVVKGATICEETHLNSFAASFIVDHKYHVRSGQIAAAQMGVDIEFPTPSIEVKVDWIPADDYSPAFTCSSPPPGVHVETINGTCYAMAGMHISSKLVKNWMWATFEPQSALTNPLRCISFGSCHDRWGARPAISDGQTTTMNPALLTLMRTANLSPEFANYRLDGVQVNFSNPDGSDSLLGNSVIEGDNAGLTSGQASCIMCHSISSIKTDGTDGLNLLANLSGNPVGPQFRLPPLFIARDFVWSMNQACPDPTHTGGRTPACPPVNASPSH